MADQPVKTKKTKNQKKPAHNHKGGGDLRKISQPVRYGDLKSPFLSRRQMEFIELFACGDDTLNNIAVRCGIGKKTAIAWRKQPKIRQLILERQGELRKNMDLSEIGRDHKKMSEYVVDVSVRDKALKDFFYFRKEFLGRKTFACQRRWVKWIEAEDHTILLCPRRHGKTITVLDYVKWQIVKDRTIRILVLSRSAHLAGLWVGDVKRALEGNKKIVGTFGVFKPNRDERWSQSELVVRGTGDNPQSTLTSLGITAALYGLRADMIICDDIVDDENAGSTELRKKLLDTYLYAVENILDDVGENKTKIVVIGTRKHPLDLYNSLSQSKEYSVHTEKAVLHWDRGNMAGAMLCPDLYLPQGGMAYWRKKRKTNGVRRFNREFQNEVADDDDIIVPAFPFKNLGNRDQRRSYGARYKNEVVIISADPGVSEKNRGTFCVTVTAYTEDNPQKRILIDYFDELISSEDQPRMLVALYHKYGASVIRIETNACQKYLLDAVKREADIGGQWKGEVYYPSVINVHPHMTSRTKLNDEKAGLETIGNAFILKRWLLPYATSEDEEKTDEFIAKICSSTYKERKKAHLLMTLWFAENEIVERSYHRQIRVVKVKQPNYLQLVKTV